MAFTHQDLVDADLVFVLELRAGGAVYRFASEDIEVTSTELGELSLVASLDVDEWEDEGDPWDDGFNAQSLVARVTFPADATAGWSAIVATRQDAGAAEAEVSLLRAGDTWEQRQKLLAGRVDEPEWNYPEDPVRFGIRQAASADRGQLPVPLARVGQETWAEDATYMFDPAIEGELYPLPVGAPGQLVGGVTVHRGSPALLVRIDKSTEDNSANNATVLLGDGELSCVGSSVTLENVSQAWSASFTPTLTTDDLGRRITVISGIGASNPISAGDQLWVSFRTANKGGVMGPRNSMMEGAGDVIRWLLSRSSQPVDLAQVAGAAEVLNGYKLAFFANQGMSPWSVLRDDIIPLLPVSVVPGPRGYFLRVWNLAATKADRVAHLNLDLEGDPAGFSRSAATEVANVLSLDYCLDVSETRHRLRLTLGPRQWPEPVAGYEPHPLCSASFTRYQDDHGQPLFAELQSTDLVQDPSTAFAILHNKAMERCGTHITAAIDGLDQDWQHLQMADVITVSSTPHQLDEHPFLVTRVLRAPGVTGLRLLSPNAWVRDVQ